MLPIFCWVPSHVGVEGNERADRAATETSRSDIEVPPMELPHRDHYAAIKAALQSKWANDWQQTTENKLRAIKDSITMWPSSSQQNRKWEVLLCRLRVGHTHLTHGHLMEGRQAPYCEDCLVPMTVIHLLIECPSYRDERRLSFEHQNQPLTIANVLGDRANIPALFDYIQRTNLYGKL